MKLSDVRPSVCLSVCPFHHSPAARRCDGFAAERRADSGGGDGRDAAEHGAQQPIVLSSTCPC